MRAMVGVSEAKARRMNIERAGNDGPSRNRLGGEAEEEKNVARRTGEIMAASCWRTQGFVSGER